MVPKAPLNDSYSYRIQAETKQQGYTILINKVLLIMCSAGAVILQKRIVKNVLGWGLGLGNIITVLPLPVSPRRQAAVRIRNHCTSSVNLDYAVKIPVVFVFLLVCQTCCRRACDKGA